MLQQSLRQALCCSRGFAGLAALVLISFPMGPGNWDVFKLISALLLGWAGNLGCWEVLQNDQSFPNVPVLSLESQWGPLWKPGFQSAALAG